MLNPLKKAFKSKVGIQNSEHISDAEMQKFVDNHYFPAEKAKAYEIIKDFCDYYKDSGTKITGLSKKPNGAAFGFIIHTSTKDGKKDKFLVKLSLQDILNIKAYTHAKINNNNAIEVERYKLDFINKNLTHENTLKASVIQVKGLKYFVSAWKENLQNLETYLEKNNSSINDFEEHLSAEHLPEKLNQFEQLFQDYKMIHKEAGRLNITDIRGLGNVQVEVSQDGNPRLILVDAGMPFIRNTLPNIPTEEKGKYIALFNNCPDAYM